MSRLEKLWGRLRTPWTVLAASWHPHGLPWVPTKSGEKYGDTSQRARGEPKTIQDLGLWTPKRVFDSMLKVGGSG
eukprot:4903168-Pyramimonas_sp.AAC.1